MPQIVKVGILKVGCIGSSPLIEFLLDERAERLDIDVHVSGTGAKLGAKECKEATTSILEHKPDIIILIGPAQQTSGLADARRTLARTGIPTIVISDGPTQKIIKDLEEGGFGYIIVMADSMIGARREFLDNIEMSLYNTDVIKVLAISGALRVISEALDSTILYLKKKENPELPRIIIDKDKAIDASGFKNPYACVKAMAAFEIARHVAELNSEACFRIKEWQRYTSIVASAHEMMRAAAKMADEAREMEKGEDSVLRRPHFNEGVLGEKRMLVEKPRR
ncbi:MAG: F420-dependent methylenetetrahydromethanopterin dehydrogenase [Thermoproteota archaeon]|nr:F420-dependent methylenetetrahydromethanopterin dehydrogenase [Thermoproteota archaeon]